jgi:hypothetical protein
VPGRNPSSNRSVAWPSIGLPRSETSARKSIRTKGSSDAGQQNYRRELLHRSPRRSSLSTRRTRSSTVSKSIPVRSSSSYGIRLSDPRFLRAPCGRCLASLVNIAFAMPVARYARASRECRRPAHHQAASSRIFSSELIRSALTTLMAERPESLLRDRTRTRLSFAVNKAEDLHHERLPLLPTFGIPRKKIS